MMLGKYGEAEEELQAISRMRGCPWYIVADLAKLRFNVGSFNSALDAAYEATLMHGELKSKVNLFTLIAKIQLVLGNSVSISFVLSFKSTQFSSIFKTFLYPSTTIFCPLST